MPGDWKGPFQRRLQKAASERGQRMAARRWELDRARRQRLAALTAEQYPARIARRIIVIDDEIRVREVTIWNWESARSWKRKQTRILQP